MGLVVWRLEYGLWFQELRMWLRSMNNIWGERIWAEKAVYEWGTQRLPGSMEWPAKVWDHEFKEKPVWSRVAQFFQESVLCTVWFHTIWFPSTILSVLDSIFHLLLSYYLVRLSQQNDLNLLITAVLCLSNVGLEDRYKSLLALDSL